MFGQLGYFNKFDGRFIEDKRPRDRYVAEARRLLGVMEAVLARQALAGGRRLLDRRHRDLPVGAQPDRPL